jgi:hypothetical protein
MKAWRRKSVVGIMATLVSATAWAKEIDRSTRSDPAGIFQIGFCARPSPDTFKKWPGHAFVAFSHQKPSGQRDFVAIGHTITAGVTPAQAIWSVVGAPVSGVLKEELYTSAMQNCLVVKVDKEDYDRAFELTKSPLQKMGLSAIGPVLEGYKLAADDCMAFMIAVANTLSRKGIVVPARAATELPIDYMRRLVTAN